MAAMARNVFGEPVRGGSKIERARKAMDNPNAGGKRDAALAYVKKQALTIIGRDVVFTQAIFYNATGETLVYLLDHSKHGKVYDSYPVRVHNGQWGAFLHGQNPVPWEPSARSEGFVVYNGKYNDTDFCKQLIAWDVPKDQNNHAYNDIYDENSTIDPEEVYEKMEAGGRKHTTVKNELYLTSSIGEGNSPLYEAIFTLEVTAPGR